MKLEDCGGNYRGVLVLGIQTNPENKQRNAIWKARVWAPKRAKSFTIVKFLHTDYHGRPASPETAYATIHVEYFTTEKEGQIKLKCPPSENDWRPIEIHEKGAKGDHGVPVRRRDRSRARAHSRLPGASA